MPDVQITLYATRVDRFVVQADSTLVTITINDENDDGAISTREWLAYLGTNAVGHAAGDTTPPVLYDSEGDGRLGDGVLYSPVEYQAGNNVRSVIRGMDRQGYAPSISSLNICYLAGTMIATPTGEVAVETLRAGDLVLTRDGEAHRLVWASTSHITEADLDLAPNKRPFRIAAGALGDGLPRRDVDVSPQHRVLVTDDDGAEYLISARHLMMAGAEGVSLRPLDGAFDLVHIAFADHQIVLAEGAPMESFFTGAMAVRALSIPQRIGLIAAFPDLDRGVNPMLPARPIIKHRDYARIVSAQHAR